VKATNVGFHWEGLNGAKESPGSQERLEGADFSFGLGVENRGASYWEKSKRPARTKEATGDGKAKERRVAGGWNGNRTGPGLFPCRGRVWISAAKSRG